MASRRVGLFMVYLKYSGYIYHHLRTEELILSLLHCSSIALHWQNKRTCIVYSIWTWSCNNLVKLSSVHHLSKTSIWHRLLLDLIRRPFHNIRFSRYDLFFQCVRSVDLVYWQFCKMSVVVFAWIVLRNLEIHRMEMVRFLSNFVDFNWNPDLLIIFNLVIIIIWCSCLRSSHQFLLIRLMHPLCTGNMLIPQGIMANHCLWRSIGAHGTIVCNLISLLQLIGYLEYLNKKWLQILWFSIIRASIELILPTDRLIVWIICLLCPNCLFLRVLRLDWLKCLFMAMIYDLQQTLFVTAWNILLRVLVCTIQRIFALQVRLIEVFGSCRIDWRFHCHSIWSNLILIYQIISIKI